MYPTEVNQTYEKGTTRSLEESGWRLDLFKRRNLAGVVDWKF